MKLTVPGNGNRFDVVQKSGVSRWLLTEMFHNHNNTDCNIAYVVQLYSCKLRRAFVRLTTARLQWIQLFGFFYFFNPLLLDNDFIMMYDYLLIKLFLIFLMSRLGLFSVYIRSYKSKQFKQFYDKLLWRIIHLIPMPGFELTTYRSWVSSIT